jgi:DMSO/TMAO reductase YedYZ heme-binding membrane subunit
MMKFQTLRLVYKNMVVGRSMLGLCGLLFMTGFCTFDVYFGALKFGHGTAVVMAIFSLIMWLVMLPMVFTMVDIKHSPKRLEKIWVEMQQNGKV